MFDKISKEIRSLGVRLNKFLADCGISSRRKADRLIADGRVSVNGRIVAALGTQVDPERDRVEVNGKAVKTEAKRYIAFHKPRLYLTSLGPDPEGKRTISELIQDIPERVYPTGRLDYDAEGLLILTNDGELGNRILHPSFEISKQYMATVEGEITAKKIEKMIKGARLEDGLAVPDKVKVIKKEGNEGLISISFHEGRFHIVKRFLEKFGFKTRRLKRTQIGPVKMGRLGVGKWRDLRPEELKQLKEDTGLG